MTDNQELFTGIGASHANEILHQAGIHPDCPINHIFKGPPILKNRFLQAIKNYFEYPHSREYQKNVSATSTTYSALSFSPSITRWYNGSFTRVYRKSGRTTRISLTQYNLLASSGMLPLDKVVAIKATNYKGKAIAGKEDQKEVMVHCFKRRVGGEKSKKHVYVYSVITRSSTYPMFSEQLDSFDAEAKRMRAEGGVAELGIASFMDIKWWEGLQKARIEAAQQEAGKGKKRGRPPGPAKGPSGQRGRPRKDPQAQAYRPKLPELAELPDPPAEDPDIQALTDELVRSSIEEERALVDTAGLLDTGMSENLQRQYHSWMENEEDTEIAQVVEQAVEEAEQEMMMMSGARGSSVDRLSGETGYLTEDSENSLGHAEL